MATTSQQYGSHYGRSTTGPKPKIGRSTLDFLMQDDKKHFMKTQENIAQRSRNGLFSHPMGLAPGDVYHDPKRKK